MRATIEFFTQVINDGADIGPFRAMNFQLQFIAFMANKQQFINGNRACFTRNFNALTRIFVQFFALVFQC